MSKRNRDEPSSDRTHWTLQQFATIAAHPWYALQRHNDGGVVWQATGYRPELEALCRRHRITPAELEPIGEEEFYRRFQASGPQDWTSPQP